MGLRSILDWNLLRVIFGSKGDYPFHLFPDIRSEAWLPPSSLEGIWVGDVWIESRCLPLQTSWLVALATGLPLRYRGFTLWPSSSPLHLSVVKTVTQPFKFFLGHFGLRGWKAEIVCFLLIVLRRWFDQTFIPTNGGGLWLSSSRCA